MRSPEATSTKRRNNRVLRTATKAVEKNFAGAKCEEKRRVCVGVGRTLASEFSVMSFFGVERVTERVKKFIDLH